MEASGVPPGSTNLSEESADISQSHRWRLLNSKPKRRHSIQVVSGFPFLTRQSSFSGHGSHGSVSPAETSTASAAGGGGANASNTLAHNKGRRQSISESLQVVTKSMSR